MADQRDGGISWTDETWNVVGGCSRVSAGCADCYAERMAVRMKGPGKRYEGLVKSTREGPRWTGKVVLFEDLLDRPFRWREPKRIFVNAMSDLFHETLDGPTIARVFAVMAVAQRHTFQVLTKRADRMREILSDPAFEAEVRVEVARSYPNAPRIAHGVPFPWPLPNVWAGVSVEDQENADRRVPELLATPAAVRWLSCEPLVGPVDLARWLWPSHWHWAAGYRTPEEAIAAGAYAEKKPQALVSAHARFVNWVVVGGESGPKARPMSPGWVRQLRDQCVASATPFHFKQWGSWIPMAASVGDRETFEKVGKKRAGRILDGRTWDDGPAARAG